MQILQEKNLSVIKNFSILTVGGVLSQVFSMLTNILLARYLAPELFGQYTLLITYISIFYTVASLGLNQVVIRTIARHQKNSLLLFRLSCVLRFGGFLITIAVVYGYFGIAHVEVDTFFFFALLLGVFANSYWEALQGVAFGMQKVLSNSIVNIIGNGLNLLLIIAIPIQMLDFKMAVIIFVVIALFKDAIYLYCLFKGRLLTIDKEEKIVIGYKKMLSDSMPFFLLALFSLMTNQLPIVFLNDASGSIEVAYFNASNKLLLPVTMLGSTLFHAVFPFMAKAYYDDFNRFVELVKKVFAVVVVGGIVAAFVVSLFRNELVLLLFGKEYAETGNVMALQCWYVIWSLIFGLIGNTMGASDHQKLLALTSLVYAAIGFPILYIAAKYGASGLAIGYLVMSVLNMTYNYYYLMKIVRYQISVLFSVTLFTLLIFSFILSMITSVDFNLYLRISIVAFFVVLAICYRKQIMSYVKM